MSFLFFLVVRSILWYIVAVLVFPFFEEEEFYLNDGVRLFC